MKIKILHLKIIYLSGILCLVTPARLYAASCELTQASTWYDTITVGTYRLQFFDHDPPGRHGARFINEGDMKIWNAGRLCTVSLDLSMVIAPIYLADEHYLYIKAYFGADTYLFVIDANHCIRVWKSPGVYGADITRTPTGFYLPSVGHLTIGQDCLPDKINGKPVSGLASPH